MACAVLREDLLQTSIFRWICQDEPPAVLIAQGAPYRSCDTDHVRYVVQIGFRLLDEA